MWRLDSDGRFDHCQFSCCVLRCWSVTGNSNIMLDGPGRLIDVSSGSLPLGAGAERQKRCSPGGLDVCRQRVS